jgi:tetratricopeptide (TPR) repeat protein
LSLARARAGLSVRDLARAAGARPSTIGGYLAGRHLPALQPADLLPRVLAACGITGEAELAAWWEALRRARRAAGEQLSPTSPDDTAVEPTQPAGPSHPSSGAETGTAHRAHDLVVSTHPPVARLDLGPAVRGRDALLRNLMRRLDDLAADPPPATPAVVLHGIAGSGKSTIALTLARRAQDGGIRVWWISASDADTVAAGMRAVAADLGGTVDRIGVERGPDLVWRLLESRPEPWLLVFDDADDPAATLALPRRPVTDGTGWLRPVRHGRGLVVVTTRDGGSCWGKPRPPWIELTSIPRLDADDASALLQILAGPGAGSALEARELAERLGGLPLALRLAGRHIAEASHVPAVFAGPDEALTYTAYQRALDHGRHAEVLGGPGVVTDAWELSLDLLARRGLPQARPVLRLISCLGPAPVGCGLILRAPIMSRSPLIGPISGRMVWEVLSALAGLGIIELTRHDGDDPYLADMANPHPLVRETSRHSADVRSDITAYVSLTASLVAEAASGLDPRNPASWQRWQALAGHCASPLDLAVEFRLNPRWIPSQALVAASMCGRYLRAAGDLSRAEALYTRVARLAGQALGEEDAYVLATHHDLCRVWYDLGRLHDSIRGFRTVHALRSRVLGPEHPDTLTTQHYLARALRDSGKVDAAFRLFRRTLDSRRNVLGPDHPDTLTSRNNAADALRALGRVDRAAAELQAVVEARVRVLGAEHPSTLVSRLNLVRLAMDRDDLTAARDEIASLIEVYLRILGPDHPRTLLARQTQVDIWHDLGDLERAMPAAEEVLAARRRVLGPRHPATLVSQHRNALMLVDLGHTELADAELVSVLAARRLVLGPGHADTALARASLDALRSRRPGVRPGKRGPRSVRSG